MNSSFHPSDPAALPQVWALYDRLRGLAGHEVLFGQQDTFLSGAAFEPNKPENLGKSDILSATGLYPGVAGFDVGHLEVYYTAQRDPEFAGLIPGKDRTGGDFEPGMNIDNVSFDYMREAIRFAYEKGSVVTLSWHSVNPLTAGEYNANVLWQESAVKAVLPGGRLNARFNLYLDAFIEFNASLTDSQGEQIPYIFRPFHEHSGDWFWWCIGSEGNPNDGTAWSGDGGRLNDPEDFAALYRYTVEYLQAHGVHNLLYCICPDRSRLAYEGDEGGFNRAFAETGKIGYPGDECIDLFGTDDYFDFGHPNNVGPDVKPMPGQVQLNRLTGVIETLCTLAQEHGKLAALTEMGVANEQVLREIGEDPRAPYTGWFLKAVQTNEVTRQLLYGLVWRSEFIGPEAPLNAVYRYEPRNPKDFSKGFERIYLYSLREDFDRFAHSEGVAFVAP